MASSRLARFKAAIKEDLEQLPDNLKVTDPSTPPAEASADCTPNGHHNYLPTTSEMQAAAKIEHGQLTPATTAFDKLTIIDNTYLDSDDDSEAGCRLEIEEVTDNEQDLKNENISSENDRPAIAQHNNLRPKMRLAQVTTHGEYFCPILPVAKYPYNYVPKAESQAVASAFFDQGQFWKREWDLYVLLYHLFYST
jgi:hypothetical protein